MIAPSIRSASWVSSAAPVWVSRAAATRNALREPRSAVAVPALVSRLEARRPPGPGSLSPGKEEHAARDDWRRDHQEQRRDHQEHRLSAWAAMRPRELPEAAAIGSRTRYGVPLIRLAART